MTTSIKHPVLTDHFFETLTKYHNDHMVHREAVTVRDRVLKRTGRNTLTGMPYIFTCLIIAQALEQAMCGYGGRSYSCTLEDEAVGFAIGLQYPKTLASVFKTLEEPYLNGVLPNPYDRLCNTVLELQQTNEQFADMIDSLISFNKE